MSSLLTDIADALRGSPLQEAAIYLLSNVPGLPPIAQTVHLLSIACIAGSILMLDLKVLGLALPSQRLSEMVPRLMPWLWWSLPALLLSGSLFVLVRPQRYFANPVFGIKFALLLPAVLLALVLHLRARRSESYWEASSARRLMAKAMAAISLLLWLGVILSGRWIAYSDYLFPGD